jgi:hypothetical protein
MIHPASGYRKKPIQKMPISKGGFGKNRQTSFKTEQVRRLVLLDEC